VSAGVSPRSKGRSIRIEPADEGTKSLALIRISVRNELNWSCDSENTE